MTQPRKTNHSGTWRPHASESADILSVECVYPLINLLSGWYGLLLNSFLCEAEDPYLAACPRNSPKTWDITIPSCNTFTNEEEEGGLLPHPQVVS